MIGFVWLLFYLGTCSAENISENSKKSHFHHKGKSSKLLRYLPQRSLRNRPSIQEEQHVFKGHRAPAYKYRLNPAAFLYPAIPTIVGNTESFRIYI